MNREVHVRFWEGPGGEIPLGYSTCLSDSSARGIAWLLLPRENPFKLIFPPRLVDPVWYFAWASTMNRRHIEARVQRTYLCWMVARLDGYAVQFNKRSMLDQSGKALVKKFRRGQADTGTPEITLSCPARLISLIPADLLAGDASCCLPHQFFQTEQFGSVSI